MVTLTRERMLSLAKKTVNLALVHGANESEAFVYQGSTSTVGIQEGQVSKNSHIIEQGLGVRTIIDKKIGFSYTNVLDKQDYLQKIVQNALIYAKVSTPDNDWSSLPSQTNVIPSDFSQSGNYDPKILNLSSEDLVTIASRMLGAAERTNKHVFPIDGGVGRSVLSKAIVNSNGIEFYDRGTIIECNLAVIAKDNNKVTPVCFEFNLERKYDIKPEEVGEQSAKLAASALKTSKIKSRTFPVIFTQFALQQLFSYTLINAVKADSVQRNQSAFKDKLGEQVASNNVTIHDDGTLTGGLRSWLFDDEGVFQQKTPIIEKGVLCNYLYDTYTAKKDRKKSTGNASRAGYLSTPQIEATNFHLLPGNTSPDDLIRRINQGIIVYFLQGAHSSNPSSGDFSVVATPVWKIKKGTISSAVNAVMLAGNIFELLKQVTLIGNNERKVGQLVAPWILVENTKVIAM